MSRVPLRALAAIVILAAILMSLFGAPAASAVDGPVVRTVPAPDQVVGTDPFTFAVFPDVGGDGGTAGSGSATVFDHLGTQVASVHLAPDPAGGLAGTVPPLAPGVHVITWRSGDLTGSVAFDVAEGAASPAQVVTDVPAPALKSTADVLAEWLPLILMLILVGALSVRFLATAPAAVRAGVGPLAPVDRRLTGVAAIAGLAFLPAAWFAEGWEDGREDWSAAWDAFGADGRGNVLLARFLLATVAAALLLVLALRRRPPTAALLGLALVAGLGELALRHVPTKQPPVMTRAVWDSTMWVGHLWGSALWVGGLVALVALAVASPVPAGVRAAFWPSAIRRFSVTAMLSVAALVLSGLWLYWVHVDSLEQLFTTLYGQTLAVKLAIFAVLLAVGGLNLFWVMPRAEVHEAAGNDGAMADLIRRHFRATVAFEAVLGLSLLFVANFLSGSSRNQALQAGDELFRMVADAGAATVGLTPSGFQPGLVEYVVDVEGAAPAQVDLTFSGPRGAEDETLPPHEVTATSLGEGRFRATGILAPIVGEWRVDVQLDRGPVASFPLVVADVPPTPPRAAPKTVSASTWFFGALDTLLVAAVLAASFRVSRRLSRPRPPAASTGEAEARELVDV